MEASRALGENLEMSIYITADKNHFHWKFVRQNPPCRAGRGWGGCTFGDVMTVVMPGHAWS